MKVLIWIGCFFVATILNTLLGYATGIKAGYLVFYFVVYFVAKKLCSKWDEHKEAKEMRKQAVSSTNAPVQTTQPAATNTAEQVRFCRKCGEKLIDNSQFCRKCGTKVDNDIVIESHIASDLNESIFEPQKEAIATKKNQRFSVCIISIILSVLSILSIIIAMNVQDFDRNTHEPLNPTVLYFVLIGVNIVYSVILIFLKEHSILKGFAAFVPALFSIIALLEGSLFSKSCVCYSYINNELVNTFNIIWVSLSFAILLVNLTPLSIALRSEWHHSVKYREKCYKRAAKMKEYLNNGIISQEEFEKNKKEILKNIEM